MAPPTPDTLDCASAQWIGKRREQEDVVKSLPAAGGMLGIVCDGMGGHLRGDCASCVVAQEFAAVFAESGVEDIPERLTEALHAANRALAAIQKEPGGIRNHAAGRLHPRPLPVVDQRGGFPPVLMERSGQLPHGPPE